MKNLGKLSLPAAEGMILLSRIIKSHFTKTEENSGKTIEIRNYHYQSPGTEEQAETQVTRELVEDARREAHKIEEEAKQRAQKIYQDIEQAKIYWEQTEKQQYIQAGYDAGFLEGSETGRSQGLAEYTHSIEMAKGIVETSKMDYLDKLAKAEQTILDLGIKVAGKIICTQLDQSEEAFVSIVKRAIKEARDYSEVELHIHPEHYQSILSQKEELQAIFPKEINVYIYPDSDLEVNSCIIESGNGRIDASVDSQLAEIKRKLADLLDRGVTDESE